MQDHKGPRDERPSLTRTAGGGSTMLSVLETFFLFYLFFSVVAAIPRLETYISAL